MCALRSKNIYLFTFHVFLITFQNVMGETEWFSWGMGRPGKVVGVVPTEARERSCGVESSKR